MQQSEINHSLRINLRENFIAPELAYSNEQNKYFEKIGYIKPSAQSSTFITASINSSKKKASQHTSALTSINLDAEPSTKANSEQDGTTRNNFKEAVEKTTNLHYSNHCKMQIQSSSMGFQSQSPSFATSQVIFKNSSTPNQSSSNAGTSAQQYLNPS